MRKSSPTHRNKRSHNYKSRYGITLEQYNEMWRAQSGKCYICGNPSTVQRLGKPIPLVVDHDHATGAVRKLLCLRCNSVLGLLEECEDLLRAAGTYLELHASP